MPNGIISKEEFEKIKDTDIKLNILFDTVIKTNKRSIRKDLEAITGGFMGGFVAMAAKFAIWK